MISILLSSRFRIAARVQLGHITVGRGAPAATDWSPITPSGSQAAPTAIAICYYYPT